MDHFLSEAKRLVQRLQHHDNAVDILIGETTNLQNKLIAMRQYKDEVVKMNQTASHRPKSTLILGSQLENQRIQSLEHENRELSVSLAEHQSALELIMNKYREQVLVMIKANGTNLALPSTYSQPSEKELELSEQIAEMALVMRKSALIDEDLAVKEIETIRSLQMENDNLRDLLNISGKPFNMDSRSTREDVSTPSSPNPAIMQIRTPVIDSSVSHKDSGIYEEDYSPNFGVFSKGKNKKKPFKGSKHVNNLESLFKPLSPTPPLATSLSPSENNEFNQDTDMIDNGDDVVDTSDHIEEEQQHQMYTVEAFVEKQEDDDDDDDDGTSLTNGYAEEDMLMHDLNAILDKEMLTDANNDENTNEHSKDTTKQNLDHDNCTNANNADIEENNALEFLDNVLDLSVDSDTEDGENDSVIENNDENTTIKDSVDISEENNSQHLVSDSNAVSTLHADNKPQEIVVANPTESEVLDFLDSSFDHELEKEDEEDDGFDSSDLQSDAESEITVVGASEEDDAMALFDSMLDDEADNHEDDDGEHNS